MSIFDSLKDGKIQDALAEIGKDKTIAKQRDSVGRTPLMYVALFVKKATDCDALVAALVTAGAEPNAQDFRNGRTALHWACEVDNLAYYEALKKHAPNQVWYLFRDNHEKTPYIIAREKQFLHLLETLEQDRWQARKSDEPMKLAVVGVGAAGAAMFIRLVKRMMMTGQRYGDKFYKDHSIYLIDDKAALGTGTAYSKELNSDTSLLNIAAAAMSIDSDQPLDFVLWIKNLELEGKLAERLGAAATLGLCPPSARGDGYYPRTFYGQYISETLDKWIVKAQQSGINVVKMPGTSVITQAQGKGSTVLTFDTKSGSKPLEVTHVFHSTGHWTEARSKTGYQANPGTIFYPANRKFMTDQGVFKQPSDIAIIGSSLSAIDAILSILLNPEVGHLSWDGDTPTYKLLKPGFKVTCYSRRGLFPRVRPQSNRDLELAMLSPATVAAYQHAHDGLKLDDVIGMLNHELAFQLGVPEIDVMKEIDPFGQPIDSKNNSRDPFAVLASDVQQAESGDGRTPDQDYVRWYQVIHSLFPVARMIYRQFSTEDRKKFDAQYSSAFLWAFAPMPDRSAKVLLAMHKVGALDLHRVDPAKKIEAKGVKTAIPYIDYANVAQHNEHDFTIMTTGLASDFDRDISPLTEDLIKQGLVNLEPKGEKEASIFMAEDGSFELLDKDSNHSRFLRGVGFFLHAQLWDVQSVPTTVKYASQVGELYFDEVRRSYAPLEITGKAKH